MATIKADVNELNCIKEEIRRLSFRLKDLRKKASDVEGRIISYLEEKQQPGVKYKGTAIIIENKNRKVRKKKNQLEEDALDVLKQHGVSNAHEVLGQILKARSGEVVTCSKLKIQKI